MPGLEEGRPVVPGFGFLSEDRGYLLFWGLGLTVTILIYSYFRVCLGWL